MRSYRIYLANADGARFCERDRGTLHRIVQASFDGYTIQDAEGGYKGYILPTVLIRIATDDGDEVVHLAERLRRLFRQEAVGLEFDGRYHSLTRDGAPIQL